MTSCFPDISITFILLFDLDLFALLLLSSLSLFGFCIPFFVAYSGWILLLNNGCWDDGLGVFRLLLIVIYIFPFVDSGPASALSFSSASFLSSCSCFGYIV